MGERAIVKIIGWIKEHPLESAGIGIGIALLIYIVTRSSSTGSTSDVSAVANSQLQQASLANQNAATQAAAQVQENEAALSAQASNNQVAAELAAQVSNNNSNVTTEQIAANVQNTTTGAQENVANNTINAELTAQQSQVAAESAGLTSELGYLTNVNNNQTSLVQSTLSKLKLGGSTLDYNTELNDTLALATGQGSATGTLGNTAIGVQNSYGAGAASITQSIVSGLSQAFSGLFA